MVCAGALLKNGPRQVQRVQKMACDRQNPTPCLAKKSSNASQDGCKSSVCVYVEGERICVSVWVVCVHMPVACERQPGRQKRKRGRFGGGGGCRLRGMDEMRCQRQPIRPGASETGPGQVLSVPVSAGPIVVPLVATVRKGMHKGRHEIERTLLLNEMLVWLGKVKQIHRVAKKK